MRPLRLFLLLLLLPRFALGQVDPAPRSGAVRTAICGALPCLTRVGRRANCRCGIAVESASTTEKGSDGVDAAPHADDSASLRRPHALPTRSRTLPRALAT